MIIHPLGDLNWRLAPGSWLGIGDLSLFRSSRLIFPSSSHLLLSLFIRHSWYGIDHWLSILLARHSLATVPALPSIDHVLPLALGSRP